MLCSTVLDLIDIIFYCLQGELMTEIRLMYWKEIPAQVQAKDKNGLVSQPLDPRFQEGIDAISMFDGSSGTDEYLDAWNWGKFIEVKEPANEAVLTLANRINQGFPSDFVVRIRDLHKSGNRNPNPGAIDSWVLDK